MSVQKRAASISLIVSFLVLALKLYAYTQTHSTGILSDALETTVNVMTALVAVIVLRYALMPADQEHPYGHGKIEYFSAAFEGGIILFAGLAIIFESIKSFFHPHTLQNINDGIGYIILATVINAIAGVYLLKVGRRNQSETLKASGAHLLADVKTTIGVVIGLIIFKYTQWMWVDSSIGVLVGVWLLIESKQIIQRNIGGLLDALDMESIEELCVEMTKHLEPAIIDIHQLRVIRSGSFHHIDAHIVVPEYYDIKLVHEIIGKFEKSVVKDCSFDGEFAFHTDPCSTKYCSVCLVENCPIRKTAFINRPPLDAASVISGTKY